jgi:cysteine desulfurase
VRLRPGRRELVTSAVEHPATEAVCALLAQDGYAVRRIQPHADGCIDADAMIAAIGERTALVTLIHAQNEIGVLQPVGAVAAAARRSGALTHADAAQSVGKVPLDVRVLGVDLLSIAGHKLYAPKGVGALYVRRGLDLPPLLVGAGQEHGHRPGTENVAGIVALGAACQLAAGTLDTERVRQQTLRDDLTARLRAEVPGLVLVGEKAERLPNTLNVLFPDVSGGRLLAACSRVCASTGSVCHADREEASTVLRALGISEHQALGAVRLSLGRHTTADDIATAATALAEAWRSLAGPQAARVTA